MADNQDTYEDLNPETFGQWFQLEHSELANLPFRLYFTKFASGTPESTEFILDPGNALRGGAQNVGTQGIAKLPLDLRPDARITTAIVGHERTLKLRAILALVTVDDQDGSVHITSHKQKPPGS